MTRAVHGDVAFLQGAGNQLGEDPADEKQQDILPLSSLAFEVHVIVSVCKKEMEVSTSPYDHACSSLSYSSSCVFSSLAPLFSQESKSSFLCKLSAPFITGNCHLSSTGTSSKSEWQAGANLLPTSEKNVASCSQKGRRADNQPLSVFSQPVHTFLPCPMCVLSQEQSQRSKASNWGLGFCAENANQCLAMPLLLGTGEWVKTINSFHMNCEAANRWPITELLVTTDPA